MRPYDSGAESAWGLGEGKGITAVQSGKFKVQRNGERQRIHGETHGINAECGPKGYYEGTGTPRGPTSNRDPFQCGTWNVERGTNGETASRRDPSAPVGVTKGGRNGGGGGNDCGFRIADCGLKGERQPGVVPARRDYAGASGARRVRHYMVIFREFERRDWGLVRLWILVPPPLGRDNGEHSSEAKVGLVPGHGHPS